MFRVMFAATALLLVSACGSTGHRPMQAAKTMQPDRECAPSAAVCSVTVDPWNDWAPGTLEITVRSESDETKNQPIVFTAVGFWFDKQTGITWDDPGKSVFKCARDKDNFSVYVCANKGQKDPRKYSYTIDLIGWDPFEPFVLNK